jgi:hypothetical protein
VGGYGFEQLKPLASFVSPVRGLRVPHRRGVQRACCCARPESDQVLPWRRTCDAGGFVASSSFAAMPVSLRSVVHNHGVDRDYAAFAVPLGASIKMDGCGAIYPALAAVSSPSTRAST